MQLCRFRVGQHRSTYAAQQYFQKAEDTSTCHDRIVCQKFGWNRHLDIRICTFCGSQVPPQLSLSNLSVGYEDGLTCTPQQFCSRIMSVSESSSKTYAVIELISIMVTEEVLRGFKVSESSPKRNFATFKVHKGAATIFKFLVLK